MQACREEKTLSGDGDQRRKVLLIGETWFTQSVHQKGFDSFVTCTYEEGCGAFRTALEAGGWLLQHVPCHRVDLDMPITREAMDTYAAVVLSDVGSNTMLLSRRTFIDGQPAVDRLQLIADYVANGGGLLMVGGYMSFSGLEGKARFWASPLADVLPVIMETGDDREERPSGVQPVVIDTSHPIMQGVADEWPVLLGFNRLKPRPSCEVLATCDDYPLLVVGTHGAGRVAAFASDMGPHWGPTAFMSWQGYGQLWNGVASWLSRRRAEDEG